jgi:hypothetical protein
VHHAKRLVSRERNDWTTRSSFRERSSFGSCITQQKTRLRRVQSMTPPRLSAVGVISLSAAMGDSMP